MTIDEVYKYFGSGKRMQKLCGMSHSNFQNWRLRGHIPIASQMKIEILTKGVLKASLLDCGEVYVDAARNK